jgi:hypothetical protein
MPTTTKKKPISTLGIPQPAKAAAAKATIGGKPANQSGKIGQAAKKPSKR